MDKELLKIVGASAGAIGILTALVILIFREILRKKIFPKFTRTQAFRTLMTIIFLSFVMGCIGIYAWITENGNETQYQTKLTVYLDSIPWELASVEIPERKFSTLTNKVGEAIITWNGRDYRRFKLLIGNNYTVNEVFYRDFTEKNIYLRSPQPEYEIGGG